MTLISQNVAGGQTGPQKSLKCQCDQILNLPADDDQTAEHVAALCSLGALNKI